MDSDVLVRQDLTPLWQPDKVWVGEIVQTPYNPVPRVAPHCCYINVPMCREKGIRYFNGDWMWQLNANPSVPESNRYDTGAYFLRETEGLPHGEIVAGDYVLHLKGGSYCIKSITPEQWIEDNSNLYHKMDFVLPFVTADDPKWVREVTRYEPKYDITRFRDFGTLKYLFRGVEKFMPWIDRIVLIVAYPSQVPKWVNQNTVRIVTHDEIMPKSILPTFNSSVIECYINNISDLSERFIYANDDMFPVGPLSADDFFKGGKPVINYTQRESAGTPFLQMCEYVNRLAAELAGLRVNHGFILPEHFFAPMLKSVNLGIIKRLGQKIPDSITKFRHPDNIHQYIYQDYYCYSRIAVDNAARYRAKRVNFNLPSQVDEIVSDLLSGEYQMYCINDEYWWTPIEPELDKIRAAFRRLFPRRSRFEK